MTVDNRAAERSADPIEIGALGAKELRTYVVGMPVPFDEAHAARYDDEFTRLAPLRDALHLVTLLAVRELPPNAHLLCVGAGTGAEVSYLAKAFPAWRFTAVDTSAPMLERCRARVAEENLQSRVAFHVGDVHQLPPEAGPFDGATAMLVSQFLLDRQERQRFFRTIADRLPARAPLVLADLAADCLEGELVGVWKGALRFNGATEDVADRMIASFGRMVSVLSPADVEQLVQAAGFDAPTPVFQSVLIHGWVARRAG